jgi:hypothetical protein
VACAGIGVVSAVVTTFGLSHGHLTFDLEGAAIDAGFALAGGALGRYGEHFLEGVYGEKEIPLSVSRITNGLLGWRAWAGGFLAHRFSDG